MALSRIQRLRAGFTTRGRCLLAAGLTALVCGLLFGSVDLARAGCLVLAAPIVAALVVNRSQLDDRQQTLGHSAAVHTRHRRVSRTDRDQPLGAAHRSAHARGPVASPDHRPGPLLARRPVGPGVPQRGLPPTQTRPGAIPRGAAADAAHRPVRAHRYLAVVYGHVVVRGHAGRRRSSASPAAIFGGRRRECRQSLDRIARRRRRLDPRVPAWRRPSQDPLAIDRPGRRADGATRGTTVARAMPRSCWTCVRVRTTR